MLPVVPSGVGTSQGLRTSKRPPPLSPPENLRKVLDIAATAIEAVSVSFEMHGTGAAIYRRADFDMSLTVAVGEMTLPISRPLEELGADSDPAVLRVAEVANSLWRNLTSLISESRKNKLNNEQFTALCGAYKLLAQCARIGERNAGLQSIRDIAMAIEPPGEPREALLKMFTPGIAAVFNESIRALLARLHVLTQISAVICHNLGVIHAFLATQPK